MTDATDTPNPPQSDGTPPALPPIVEEAAAAKPAPKKARSKRSRPTTAPTSEDRVWVVSRASGLHQIPAEADGSVTLGAGMRLATARDLDIGGVNQA